MKTLSGVKAKFLNLGDIVTLAEYPYSHCTVIKINTERKEVTTIRPYIHVADFSYGGNNYTSVIPYIGHEESTFPFNTMVTLLEKGPQLK